MSDGDFKKVYLEEINPHYKAQQLYNVLVDALPYLPPVPAGDSILRHARKALEDYDGISLTSIATPEDFPWHKVGKLVNALNKKR